LQQIEGPSQIAFAPGAPPPCPEEGPGEPEGFGPSVGGKVAHHGIHRQERTPRLHLHEQASGLAQAAFGGGRQRGKFGAVEFVVGQGFGLSASRCCNAEQGKSEGGER